MLGNKRPGERHVGAHGIVAGAGKRAPSIPTVTGAPSVNIAGANSALPGKPSRGLATNFGARSIAPFRPGSRMGIKASYQPLTLRRPIPFLETQAPVQESPPLQGFPKDGSPMTGGVADQSLTKLHKVMRRKVSGITLAGGKPSGGGLG